MYYLLLVQLILLLDAMPHLVLGQLYHQSSVKVGVDFQNLLPQQSGNAMAKSESNNNRTRNRYMYALCPPGFQRVGTECYSLLTQHTSWLDAHFYCKDKNAKLAEPRKFSDRKLREFLRKQDSINGANDVIWIGAWYDWLNRVWQWSHTGQNLTYNAFSNMDHKNGVNMENQCAVYDPQLNYRWSSRLCVDKQRFLCQHKMPKVSEKNRYKVYNRWNITYPNQLANEVLLQVIDRRTQVGSRINRRVKAEDSSEEMLVPIRRPNYSRKRPSISINPNSATGYIRGSHTNRIHYKEPEEAISETIKKTDQSNDIEFHGLVTPVPEHIENERRRQRQHLYLDRKLNRQREKEIRRMRRKKERQENLLRERQQRVIDQRRGSNEQRRRTKSERQRQRKHHEGKLNQLQQREHQKYQQQKLQREKYAKDQQKVYDRVELTTPMLLTTTETTTAPTTLNIMTDAPELQIARNDDEDWHYQNYLKKRKQLEEQEKLEREAIKRQEYELQLAEQHRLEEEHKLLKERQRKEYEELLQKKANEKARLLLEEQERIRLQDEANRQRLQFEEQQRQEELQRQLSEEAERLRLEQLAQERRVEEEELARVRAENKRREELQRKRAEEIARLEEEKKRLQAEEERITREQELAEQQRKLQHEYQIQRAEEEARLREEQNKRLEEQEYLQRLEKIEKARRLENERMLEMKKQGTKNYADRVAKLSKEDQQKFFEMRKLRRTLKEQLKRMNREKEADANNKNKNESFIPNNEN